MAACRKSQLYRWETALTRNLRCTADQARQWSDNNSPVFRELLRSADSVWITNFILDKERCLVLCAPHEWYTYEAILKDQTDRELQLFRTFLIGGGEEVRIDRRGRIRIPPRLLKFVNRTPLPNVLPSGEPRTVLLCRPETRPRT